MKLLPITLAIFMAFGPFHASAIEWSNEEKAKRLQDFVEFIKGHDSTNVIVYDSLVASFDTNGNVATYMTQVKYNLQIDSSYVQWNEYSNGKYTFNVFHHYPNNPEREKVSLYYQFASDTINFEKNFFHSHYYGNDAAVSNEQNGIYVVGLVELLDYLQSTEEDIQAHYDWKTVSYSATKLFEHLYLYGNPLDDCDHGLQYDFIQTFQYDIDVVLGGFIPVATQSKVATLKICCHKFRKNPTMFILEVGDQWMEIHAYKSLDYEENVINGESLSTMEHFHKYAMVNRFRSALWALQKDYCSKD